MGYQNSSSGIVTMDQLIHLRKRLSINAAVNYPLGIDPDGKTIWIYKISFSSGDDIRYNLGDAGGKVIFDMSSQYQNGFNFDLGLTPIVVATVGSDLYILNLVIGAAILMVNVWYTLQ